MARTLLDVDLANVENCAFGKGSAVLFSARKPEREGPNEDAAALIPIGEIGCVAAVCDGAGGHPAGAEAARLAIQELVKAVEAIGDDVEQLRNAILNGFEAANQAIMDLGVGAATTLAVVEVQQGILRTYHAGDSMILVTGLRGKVKLLTVPHSPVGYAVEAGLLDPKEALHHDDLHLVSNLLGRPDMRIEIASSLSLATYDTVLVASDGLSDNVHLKEIIEGIRKGPLKKGAAQLAELGKKRMQNPQEGAPSKPDDLTFVAFRLGRS